MATKKEIIERLDLPALIQDLIPSCKQAGRELSGLCPFHEDQNPSLSVNPVSGAYKCHACGEKGSIFDLYGKVHGLDFKGSITALTDRAGLAPGKGNVVAGTSKPNEVDRHDYQDAAGNLLYQRVRFEPGDNGRSKKYLPFDPATGQWKRPGVPVLYHLPDVVNASTVFIFEGERKADVAKSWGLVGTCFDSGANSTITPAMVEVLTGKHIVIVPDNDDPGRGHRDNIIKAMQGKAVSIKVVDLSGIAVKGDIVDWIQTPGNDKERFFALAQQASEWNPETETKPEDHESDQEPSVSMFISASDMLSQPVETKPLLGNVIERGCTGQMFGPSGGGKTFVALDMSLAVGTGGSWNGNQCERGIVLYFAGEGHSGLKRRVKAWSKHNGYPDLSSVHVSRSVISFDAAGLRRVKSEVKALEEQTAQQVTLIVIDTLARHLLGDENSTRDMSEFVSSVDGLRNNFPGSTALIVHHTGNNAEQVNRSRGSSALKGACDFEIQCDKGLLTYTKVKDGAPPEPVEFNLIPVEIGTDDDGEPITSCIVVYGERSAKNKEVRLTQMESQLLELINKQPGILSGDLKNLFNEHRKARDTDVTPAALKKSFSRALDGLIEKKKAYMDGNSVKEGQGTFEGHSGDMSRQVKGTDRDIILKGCPDVPPVSLSEILTLDESDLLEVFL